MLLWRPKAHSLTARRILRTSWNPCESAREEQPNAGTPAVLSVFDNASDRIRKGFDIPQTQPVPEALRELNYIITSFQDDQLHISARQFKDEIETPRDRLRANWTRSSDYQRSQSYFPFRHFITSTMLYRSLIIGTQLTVVFTSERT